MSPEAQAYAERAQKATDDARRARELQVEAGHVETALTVAAAHAMLPHIVTAFGDTPSKQAERRADLLEATYGTEVAA